MTVSANTRRGGLLETATILIEALAIAMLVRTFLYQPFNIPSGSMEKTLLNGDVSPATTMHRRVSRGPPFCSASVNY